ncbi:MAG: hypothetical protein Q9184_005952, partial [Pyrenodesmia sp. 2 TL-2023]
DVGIDNAFRSNCYPYTSFIAFTTPNVPTLRSARPINGGSNTGARFNDPTLCVTNNNQLYTDEANGQHQIACGRSYASTGDLYATVLPTLDACVTYCSLYDACVAVTFTGYIVGNRAPNCYPSFPIHPRPYPHLSTSFSLLALTAQISPPLILSSPSIHPPSPSLPSPSPSFPSPSPLPHTSSPSISPPYHLPSFTPPPSLPFPSFPFPPLSLKILLSISHPPRPHIKSAAFPFTLRRVIDQYQPPIFTHHLRYPGSLPKAGDELWKYREGMTG